MGNPVQSTPASLATELTIAQVATETEVTQEQAQQFVDALVQTGMLTEQQALAFLGTLNPEQVGRILSQFNGERTIDPARAAEMWGLTSEEAATLFSPQTGVLLRTNPFGAAFLRFMQLAYELELDLKHLMQEVLQRQVDFAIEAAEERFTGAIVQFACAMAAALVSFGCGVMSFRNAKNMSPNKPTDNDAAASAKAATDNQWFSPIGASLMTQPLNAAGEFGNQYYQFEGATTQAYADEAGKLYEQLVSMYQSTRESEKTMASGA